MKTKNDKIGWDVHRQKKVRYSYISEDGGVFRSDGYCVGNHIAGDFMLNISQSKTKSLNPKEWIVTVEQRVHDLYEKTFNGHPSREDDAKNKEAIIFLAKQIDILHKLRIKNPPKNII